MTMSADRLWAERQMPRQEDECNGPSLYGMPALALSSQYTSSLSLTTGHQFGAVWSASRDGYCQALAFQEELCSVALAHNTEPVALWA